MEATTLTCKDRFKISVLIETNSLNDIRQILEKYTLPLEDMVGIIRFIMKTHYAWEKIEIIKMLHNEFGLDISGNSSMFVKLIKNYPHSFMIKLFVDLGIDIHVDDGKLLMISCRYKFLENVKLLLDLGVNPNIRTGKALMMVLKRAERWSGSEDESDKLDIIKLLFQYGLNYIHKDALVTCVSESYFSIAKLLLESGADVNAENGAALIRASRYLRYEYIELFLNYGANIDCFSHKENQDKYNSDYYIRYVKARDLLLNSGVDPVAVMKFTMFGLP